ncbi:hypothetical protein [Bosea sp. NBC_00550]|nr:hypothetical protein [Bosea sp. NBC_00550]UZF90426.1 hypothetical protein NWE53_14845 [Bosea sp. NBC_00550]
MTITTKTEYEAAKKRIVELAGCAEDTPEEHELINLQLAVEVWESKKRIG